MNEYFKEHIVEVTEKTLSRVSGAYQRRFQELGMGLPFIVKVSDKIRQSWGTCSTSNTFTESPGVVCVCRRCL
jgi:hypothetical protein